MCVCVCVCVRACVCVCVSALTVPCLLPPRAALLTTPVLLCSGNCVCGRCSSHRWVLSEIDKSSESRVCEPCFQELSAAAPAEIPRTSSSTQSSSSAAASASSRAPAPAPAPAPAVALASVNTAETGGWTTARNEKGDVYFYNVLTKATSYVGDAVWLHCCGAVCHAGSLVLWCGLQARAPTTAKLASCDAFGRYVWSHCLMIAHPPISFLACRARRGHVFLEHGNARDVLGAAANEVATTSCSCARTSTSTST